MAIHSLFTSASYTDKERNEKFKYRDTRFKQQKLPSWQPIFTSRTITPFFFGLGLIFLPLGIVLLITSNDIVEHIIDYTDCLQLGTSTECAEVISQREGKQCICEISVVLQQFTGDVLIYYGLTNFYQNHRRYVVSRDDRQLNGEDVEELQDNCEPFKTTYINGSRYNYAPCGGIANSMFNDTFSFIYLDEGEDVDLYDTGIAWESDKNIKLKNPKNWHKNRNTKPPYWQESVWELDPEDPDNNGYINEDLMVWMRTAALPKFFKLFRRVNHTKPIFSKGLPMGNYLIRIEYNYPVKVFGGTKHVRLTTTSWIGGKNPFLGVAYIAIGSLCILFGFVFLFVFFMIRSLDENDAAKLKPQTSQSM